MSQSVDAPFPPPPSAGTDTQSTKDTAKEEARNVGQSAAEAGGAVASTAADQAKTVAQETQRQAKDLLGQGRSQLRDQAVSQQQRAAQGLSSLAEQLRGMAEGRSDDAPGPARDLVHQASSKLEEFGSFLQNREPADLLDEVRRYARRKPGMFLLGAALAGVVAGRLTSGVKAAHDGGSGSLVSSGGSGGGRSSYYGDPSPTYSGYGQTTGYSQGSEYAQTAGYGETAGHGQTAGYGESYQGTTGGSYQGTTGGAPLPPPPYGTAPPEGSVVPPTAPAGWDDPARRTGGVS